MCLSWEVAGCQEFLQSHISIPRSQIAEVHSFVLCDPVGHILQKLWWLACFSSMYWLANCSPSSLNTHTHTHTGQGDRGHLGLVSGRFYEQEKLTWFNQQGNFPGLSEAKAKRVELHTRPSVSLKFILEVPSYVQFRWSISTWLSQGAILGAAPAMEWWSECTFQEQAGAGKPPIAPVQMAGQTAVTTSA